MRRSSVIGIIGRLEPSPLLRTRVIGESEVTLSSIARLTFTYVFTGHCYVDGSIISVLGMLNPLEEFSQIQAIH